MILTIETGESATKTAKCREGRNDILSLGASEKSHIFGRHHTIRQHANLFGFDMPQLALLNDKTGTIATKEKVQRRLKVFSFFKFKQWTLYFLPLI